MGHAEEKTKVTGQIQDLADQITAAKAAKTPKDEVSNVQTPRSNTHTSTFQSSCA